MRTAFRLILLLLVGFTVAVICAGIALIHLLSQVLAVSP